jgi:hypothetical protein
VSDDVARTLGGLDLEQAHDADHENVHEGFLGVRSLPPEKGWGWPTPRKRRGPDENPAPLRTFYSHGPTLARDTGALPPETHPGTEDPPMQAILDLLKDNEPLTRKLKAATSVDDAAQILAKAAAESGQQLGVAGIRKFLAERPKVNPEALSEEELMAVSGGQAPRDPYDTKLVACSQICCYTCRTSQVSW